MIDDDDDDDDDKSSFNTGVYACIIAITFLIE